MPSDAVVCRQVRRAYRVGSELVWALRGVDAEAHRGELTVFAGPSGSGKTTLLRLVAAIDLPDDGTVTVAGREVGLMSAAERRRFRRRHLGFVFQDPAANLLGYLTAVEHLQLAARLRGTPGTSFRPLLEAMELEEVAGELPHHLSSGQQQRLALAMAVVGDPEVVVADEPTAELDTESAKLVLDALDRLRGMGSTLVVSSHDPEVLAVADRVVRLDHGKREV